MTDDRYKQIMAALGMPNSRSLLSALQQVANEACQAAQAAERERCVGVVRYWLTGHAPSAGTYEARCVAHILEGQPSSAWRERSNAI